MTTEKKEEHSQDLNLYQLLRCAVVRLLYRSRGLVAAKKTVLSPPAVRSLFKRSFFASDAHHTDDDAMCAGCFKYVCTRMYNHMENVIIRETQANLWQSV